jgi:hypothetical protein
MSDPVEFEKRALALQAWFCKATSQNLSWSVVWRFRWEQWLAAGHNGIELRRVILYLRREISAGRRNPGALKLINLLDVENFESDLGLCDMKRAGKFDVDCKLPAAPETLEK